MHRGAEHTPLLIHPHCRGYHRGGHPTARQSTAQSRATKHQPHVSVHGITLFQCWEDLGHVGVGHGTGDVAVVTRSCRDFNVQKAPAQCTAKHMCQHGRDACPLQQPLHNCTYAYPSQSDLLQVLHIHRHAPLTVHDAGPFVDGKFSNPHLLAIPTRENEAVAHTYTHVLAHQRQSRSTPMSQTRTHMYDDHRHASANLKRRAAFRRTVL